MNVVSFETLKEAVIRHGETEVRITIDDARQIRDALLAALEQSDLGDRDELIAFTKPLPAWIDSDGRVMVGGWLLQLRNQQLVATYRLSQSAGRAVGYAAFVVKNDESWQITQIVPEKILFNR